MNVRLKVRNWVRGKLGTRPVVEERSEKLLKEMPHLAQYLPLGSRTVDHSSMVKRLSDNLERHHKSCYYPPAQTYLTGKRGEYIARVHAVGLSMVCWKSIFRHVLSLNDPDAVRCIVRVYKVMIPSPILGVLAYVPRHQIEVLKMPSGKSTSEFSAGCLAMFRREDERARALEEARRQSEDEALLELVRAD